jgi:hypothetical protein
MINLRQKEDLFQTQQKTGRHNNIPVYSVVVSPSCVITLKYEFFSRKNISG